MPEVPGGGAPRPASARPRAWHVDPTRAAMIALALLVVGNALLTPNFATAGNLWNVLLQLSTVLLVAVGMTLVIATRGIDLSVGSVMALAGAIAATQLDRPGGGGLLVAVPLALLGAVVVGVVNGVLVARARVQPIVVTLATLIGVRGLAQIVSRDGELVTVADATFARLGQGALGPVPVPVLVALAACVAAAVVLRDTAFGRYVLAVGGNAPAARLAGVPVTRTLVSVYAASALLAGIAGLVVVARLGASDAAKIGQNVELDAIAAAVVGGTTLAGGRATIVGTVVGALIMQVIATSFNMLLVPYAWSLALKAAILLAAVYLQRPGRV
jgi:simple sugar transport system permease protein/ribose transport system permease protein